MAMPKWQEEVEAILRERHQGDGDGLSKKLKRAYELIELATSLKPPCDDYGEIVGIMMKLASMELPPLPATYSGFMLGVAYERTRNAV